MEEKIFYSKDDLVEYLKTLPEDTMCRITVDVSDEAAEDTERDTAIEESPEREDSHAGK